MLTSLDLTMSSSAYVTDSEIAPAAPDLTIDDLQPQVIQLQDQGFTQQQLVDWMTSQGAVSRRRRAIPGTANARIGLCGARVSDQDNIDIRCADFKP